MRTKRIIASLMALLMTLSALSGLCVPTYAAESAQIEDAAWTGYGFYVTGDIEHYKLVVMDEDMFEETEEGLRSKDRIYSIKIVDDKETKKALEITNNASNITYVIRNLSTGAMVCKVTTTEKTETIDDYTKMIFVGQTDKLLTMQKMLETDTHALYVQFYTGEVACLDKTTGQTLFSNPYDVSTCDNKSTDVRSKLVSQILLDYTDLTGNSKTMTSYEQAALNGQINVKLIKGGVRVEYTMGREEANYLVPRMISKERYETLIKNVIENHPDATPFVKNRFNAFYLEKNPETTTLDVLKEEMLRDYPITKKMPVYVLSNDIVTREIAELEEFIKTYCPDYTYDDLEYDHNLTEYTGQEKAPANFKLSIEYSLNADGMTARLPANGIRYDATNYTLKSIKILPYMGAGSNENTGYIFLPDGSGSITRFEDFVGKSINVAGTLYGTDYAYHTVSGRLQETMRLPVYGIVDNDSYVNYESNVERIPLLDDEGNPVLDNEGNPVVNEKVTYSPVVDASKKIDAKLENATESKGFLAIIEEGDAMVSIMSTGGSTTHKYFNVETTFSPRQSDEYRLSDSISAASSAAIIVESKRKYVGSLTIKYVMLTDKDRTPASSDKNYYEPTWMGMAKAYRDYLTANGTLSKLESVAEDLPLYIETFGTLETTEKIASIPVTVDKALTSFEQIKTMYDELSTEGISNINFKLQGYYNGGMYATVPYKLKWQDAAGGEEGFKDLVSYSKEKGFGVYPDFDFAYMHQSGWFDGFSEKEHAVKTIDNRYSSRVMYNAAKQDYTTFGGLCISPSAFGYLFEGLDERYSVYGTGSISVSTLGYALNSDFDEKDPYNREDSKALTAEVLSEISSKYDNVMAEGGNAYTLKYIDHLLGVSLDSSRYALTSAAVPFMGAVIHGSINFTGTPINMEGDMDYALLKAIENGASLYFILSYENTELLKEDASLSKYYSVRYDIWKKDVIEIYNRLNVAIGDLQDQFIVDHEFLDASRVPDADEAENDKLAAENAAQQKESQTTTKATKTISQRLNALYVNGDIATGLVLSEIKDKELIATLSATFAAPTVTEENGTKIIAYADGLVLTVSADNKVVASIDADVYNQPEVKDDANAKVFDKYATTYGTVAKVVYENGTTFILNYNDYSIVVVDDGVQYTLPAYTFVTIKGGVVYNYNASEDAILFGAVGSDSVTEVASGKSATLN